MNPLFHYCVIAYEDIPANPTFPEPQGSKYHRGFMLSLLCSEWEEVGHIKLNHREVAAHKAHISTQRRQNGLRRILIRKVGRVNSIY